jgi:hypothetical protein
VAPSAAEAQCFPSDLTVKCKANKCDGKHSINPKRKQNSGHQPAHKPKPVTKPRYPAPETCFGDTFVYACLPPAPKTKKKPATPDPSALIREVVAKLKLPDPTPRFGPDPNNNQWHMLAVGFPIWLWTNRPTTLTTTAHHDGLTFTLQATWQSTTFTTGDGHTTTCTTTTTYPQHLNKPGTPSPTCGHTYDTASPKNHPYTVTAQTNWQINWTANHQHGTLTTTYTGQHQLEIGELQALVRA